MSKIDKGYHVRVTTWENDGDNYQDNEVVVDSLERADEIAESVLNFNNDHSDGDVKTFGDPDEDDYFGEDHLEDLIGTWCDWEYYRVVEKISIYYVPEDIVFLKDYYVK